MNASTTKSTFVVNADLKFFQRTTHVCIGLNGTLFDSVEFPHVVAIETADSINSYELFSNNNKKKKNCNDDRFIYTYLLGRTTMATPTPTHKILRGTFKKYKEFPFRSISKSVKTFKVDIYFYLISSLIFFLLSSCSALSNQKRKVIFDINVKYGNENRQNMKETKSERNV